jgi:hypothetical protein
MPLSIYQFSDQLALFRACDESRKWIRDFATIEEAYAACHDARWLMWFANHTVGEEKRTSALHDLILSMLSQIDSLDIEQSYKEGARLYIEKTAKWVVGPRSLDVTNDLRLALFAQARHWMVKHFETSSFLFIPWKMSNIYDVLFDITRMVAFEKIHAVVHTIYATHVQPEDQRVFNSLSIIPLAVDQASGLSSIVKKHISIDDYMNGFNRAVECL